MKLLEDGGKPVYVTFTGQSPQEHLGELKLAKFQAFLSHVINKHRNLPNRLFNACAHGEIATPRVWMRKGTKICYVIPKTNQSKPVFGTGTASNYYIHFILCFSIRGI